MQNDLRNFAEAGGRTLRIASEAIPRILGRAALEPVRLSGREGVNSLFCYELLLQTPDSLNLDAGIDFNLDDFIGREVSCSIDLDGRGQFVPGHTGAAVDHLGAGTREINALIASASFCGENERQIQYRLTLRPWLYQATLRTDCRIFQNKTVVEILDELLARYSFPVEKRLYDAYPARAYQTQYNESDFAFFERLTQEWGISYHFEHAQGKQRLVLSDAMAAFRESASEAYRTVEYHPPGWKMDAEYIHSVVAENHLTSGRYATSDYDYTRPRADLSQGMEDPRPTGQADAEVYEWHHGLGGAHYVQPETGTAAQAGTPQDEGRQLARLRMQALRTRGARARASGNLRGIVPGCTFRLTGHPRRSANAQYLILDTRFLIEDVVHNSQGGQANHHQWKVEVDVILHPVKEPLRPELTRLKPFVRGPQSARVVGPADQNIWTDEYGRIKVKFPWDRLGEDNQNASCWIRVSSSWAGNQLGETLIPRIGQEVIVSFFDGDPDLPVCTGRLHNRNNLPPWRLADQSALSGWRSRELTDQGGNGAGGRSNHLLLDDTKGEIQAQLKSDHQSSSVSLGFITRIEDNAGRKDVRGEGVEVRTDGHGVIRAMKGMLISTEGRPNAQGHAKAMEETVGRLAAGQALHEGLSDSALQAQIHGAGDQDLVARDIQAQNDAVAGGPAGGGRGSFPELAQPHLVLASPAGIESTTAGSTHLASEVHNALTSGGHTSIAAGKSLLASVKQAIRLFAYEAGIRLAAAAGDLEFSALKNSMKFFAKVDITMDGDDIFIRARKRLTLAGNVSSIVLDGDITGKTPGRWVEHAAQHLWAGPDNTPPRTTDWDGQLHLRPPEQQLQFALQHLPEQSPLLFANQPYTLFKNGTKVEDGVLDEYGRVTVDKAEQGATYQVRLANGTLHAVPVAKGRMEADTSRPAHYEQHLSNRGFRADGQGARQRWDQQQTSSRSEGTA